VPGVSLDAVVARLRAAGGDAFAVGASARALLSGSGCEALWLATNTAPEPLLARFPGAAVISSQPFAIALGGGDPPLRICARDPAIPLERELCAQRFRVEAIALELPSRRAIDPLGGLHDWRERRLRFAAPAERVAADPQSALRAARLCAELELDADAEVLASLREAPRAPRPAGPAQIRHEVARLLLARGVARGLALLRAIGREQELVPGVRADAVEVVARLPSELPLRLLGWLRGSNAGRALRRLQIPPARAAALERILRFHPIELRNPSGAERLHRRLGPEALRWLIELREAELAAEPRGLAEHSDLLARWRATGTRAGAEPSAPLALGGRDVIEILGCRPGPVVGRALAYLARCVAEDAAENQRERLSQRLRDWARAAASSEARDAGRMAPT
jgi:hypothetical protein